MFVLCRHVCILGDVCSMHLTGSSALMVEEEEIIHKQMEKSNIRC